MIALGAAVALFRYRQGVVMVIVACGLIGLAVSLVRRVSGGVTLSRRSTSADLGSDPWITLRPGGLLALASAALFGATPPMSKPLLAEMSPFLLAGLLYLGAGLGLAVVAAVRRLSRTGEDRRSRDLHRWSGS